MESLHGTSWITVGHVGKERFFWPMNDEGVCLSLKREPTIDELRAFLEYCKDPSNDVKYPSIPFDSIY
jgi:hypothetical protein